MVSIAQTLQTALGLHQAGRLDDAESAYRDIVRQDPRHADALHLLGIAAHQRGRHQTAIEFITRAIAVNPAAVYHSNLGAAYRAAGDRKQAVASLRAAVRINPRFADAQYNLGTLLFELGSKAEAIAALSRAVEIDPRLAGAWNNLGLLHFEQGSPSEAAECYRRALEISPGLAAAHNNLGTALSALEQFDEAAESCRRAIEINPNDVEAHFNLGNVLRDVDRLDEAADCYRRALELNPRHVAAFVNLGLVYQDRCELDAALACNNRAIALDPSHVEAHINRSFVLRLKGDFAAGWREFEWRWREENIPDRFRGPVWDGSPLAGKTILIFAEQGVGDEIMFASCMPDVARDAKACIVECDARLIPLFARSFPTARVIPRWEGNAATPRPEIPQYDYHIAMGSLPQFLRPNAESFPRHAGYLVADGALKDKWRRRYAELGPGPKVGISWRGGKRASVKRKRTTSLAEWRPLLSLPGVHFVNLQYGDCRQELADIRRETGCVVHGWADADPLTNLVDFAAQVAALDLVISIDNSTVHMAGALGVPVWNLIPFSPDWRWMLQRDDTLWYPSMRLFRQPRPGDWAKVVEELVFSFQRSDFSNP